MSGSTGVAATAAETFVQSIGINIHTEDWNPSDGYGNASGTGPNIALIESELSYLGIDHVRDAVGYSPSVSTPAYQQLGEAGIKLDLFTTTGGNIESLTQELSDISTLAPYVVSIEGPNESDGDPNFSYQGLTGFAAVDAMQKALYQDVKASATLKSLPVIAPSEGQTASFPQVGNLAAYADYANIHAYNFSYGESTAEQVQWRISEAQIIAPGRPSIATETGTPVLPENPWGISVDNTTQAVFTLDAVLDDFKAGISATYLYQLMDQPVEGQDWGLFTDNGVARPSATALHNLTSILADPASNAQSFATGSLDYAVSGLPATGNTLLMEKANGTFDLTVWNEPTIWNSSTTAEVPVSSTSVTVNLGGTFQNVAVYDPLNSAAPVQTLTNVSTVTLALTDHPLIIQVNPNSAAAITVAEPASISVGAGKSAPISGITLADSGLASTTQMTLTLADSTGTLSMKNMATAATLGSTGGNSITVTDTLANLNADLATLSYTASNTAGSDSVTMNVTGGGASAAGHIAVSIMASTATNHVTVAAGKTVTTTAGTTNIVTMQGGSDTLYSNGNDTINAKTGPDTIIGGSGNTILNTGAGKVWMVQGSGSLVVNSGSGETDVTMGSGQAIDHMAGTDYVDAGTGVEQFDFAQHAAQVAVVFDFVVGTDHLHLTNYGAGPAGTVTNIANTSAGVTMTLNDGTYISLPGVHDTTLSHLFN